ncbi:aminopeptidase [Mycobacterium kansasii]|nr:aminopeptidase [Mycobacterium kansasii]
MTLRRLIIAVGAVLLVAGVIGLLVPVSVSNSNGGSISCGNGFATDLSAARNANDSNGANIPILNQVIPHTDFVGQCESAVSSRRMWTIPLVVIGVIGIAGALAVRRSQAADTSVGDVR